MKVTQLVYISSLAIALVLGGCSKESDTPTRYQNQPEAKRITDKDDQEQILESIDKLPSIAVYNETMDKYVLLDLSQAKNGFNFSSPSGGISFSSPNGNIQFVEGPDGAYYQVVTPGSGGGGGAGGIVTAGPFALDVSYVLCFNSGDPMEGVDFFGVGEGFSGFSGAVGIAGDFEALANMSESELENSDPFEFFQGFVAYYAFDGTANGPYEVVDFFNAQSEDDSFLENKGLAYFISFQGEGGIFFSVDGEVTFSGNSVSFNGTYWGITDFILGFGESFESDDEPDFIEVNGFGALTCQ
jgi:hypothetical protein